MGTPGSGRKRTPMKDRFSAEDEALGHIAREAEARLAAKRAARAEARDIRMRELERQQKETYAWQLHCVVEEDKEDVCSTIILSYYNSHKIAKLQKEPLRAGEIKRNKNSLRK